MAIAEAELNERQTSLEPEVEGLVDDAVRFQERISGSNYDRLDEIDDLLSSADGQVILDHNDPEVLARLFPDLNAVVGNYLGDRLGRYFSAGLLVGQNIEDEKIVENANHNLELAFEYASRNDLEVNEILIAFQGGDTIVNSNVSRAIQILYRSRVRELIVNRAPANAARIANLLGFHLSDLLQPIGEQEISEGDGDNEIAEIPEDVIEFTGGMPTRSTSFFRRLINSLTGTNNEDFQKALSEAGLDYSNWGLLRGFKQTMAYADFGLVKFLNNHSINIGTQQGFSGVRLESKADYRRVGLTGMAIMGGVLAAPMAGAFGLTQLYTGYRVLRGGQKLIGVVSRLNAYRQSRLANPDATPINLKGRSLEALMNAGDMRFAFGFLAAAALQYWNPGFAMGITLGSEGIRQNVRQNEQYNQFGPEALAARGDFMRVLSGMRVGTSVVGVGTFLNRESNIFSNVNNWIHNNFDSTSSPEVNSGNTDTGSNLEVNHGSTVSMEPSPSPASTNQSLAFGNPLSSITTETPTPSLTSTPKPFGDNSGLGNSSAIGFGSIAEQLGAGSTSTPTAVPSAVATSESSSINTGNNIVEDISTTNGSTVYIPQVHTSALENQPNTDSILERITKAANDKTRQLEIHENPTGATQSELGQNPVPEFRRPVLNATSILDTIQNTKTIVVEVSSGDTLNRIAQENGFSSWKSLAPFNPGLNPDNIVPGQKLNIPIITPENQELLNPDNLIAKEVIEQSGNNTQRQPATLMGNPTIQELFNPDKAGTTVGETRSNPTASEATPTGSVLVMPRVDE